MAFLRRVDYAEPPDRTWRWTVVPHWTRLGIRTFGCSADTVPRNRGFRYPGFSARVDDEPRLPPMTADSPDDRDGSGENSRDGDGGSTLRGGSIAGRHRGGNPASSGGGSRLGRGGSIRPSCHECPIMPNALHLLGVVRHQQGQSASAVELIGKAVAINPGPLLPRQPRRGVPCARASSIGRSAVAGPPSNSAAISPRPGTTSAWPCRPSAEWTRPRSSSGGPGDPARPDSPWRTPTSATSCARRATRPRRLEHFRQAVRARPQPGRRPDQPRPVPAGLTAAGGPGALPGGRPACSPTGRGPQQPRQRAPGTGPVRRGQDVLRRGAAAEPDLAMTHANMGLALQEEGQLDEALPWYQQAVRAGARTPPAFIGNLASAAGGEGERREPSPLSKDARG